MSSLPEPNRSRSPLAGAGWSWSGSLTHGTRMGSVILTVPTRRRSEAGGRRLRGLHPVVPSPRRKRMGRFDFIDRTRRPPPSSWREATWVAGRPRCSYCREGKLGGVVTEGPDGAPRLRTLGWVPATSGVQVQGRQLVAWRIREHEKERLSWATVGGRRVRPAEYRPPVSKRSSVSLEDKTWTFGRPFVDAALPLLIQCWGCRRWNLVQDTGRPRSG